MFNVGAENGSDYQTGGYLAPKIVRNPSQPTRVISSKSRVSHACHVETGAQKERERDDPRASGMFRPVGIEDSIYTKRQNEVDDKGQRHSAQEQQNAHAPHCVFDRQKI